MQNLGVNKPDLQPKATDYIHEMITMIKSLINKEVAYVADKHVLFNVKKYKFYGVLSRRTKEEQIAGSRIEVASYKKIQRILFYGNQVKLMNQVGSPHGEKADLDGISSVVLCQKNVWVLLLTFIVVEWI